MIYDKIKNEIRKKLYVISILEFLLYIFKFSIDIVILGENGNVSLKIISRLMIKCVNCDRRRNAPYKIDLYNLCRFGEK